MSDEVKAVETAVETEVKTVEAQVKADIAKPVKEESKFIRWIKKIIKAIGTQIGELGKDIAFVFDSIRKGIVGAWLWFWKIFSNDPVASCSRILAWACAGFVLYEGHKYFANLTSVQAEFLKTVFYGVVPYALDKAGTAVGNVVTSFKAPQK